MVGGSVRRRRSGRAHVGSCIPLSISGASVSTRPCRRRIDPRANAFSPWAFFRLSVSDYAGQCRSGDRSAAGYATRAGREPRRLGMEVGQQPLDSRRREDGRQHAAPTAPRLCLSREHIRCSAEGPQDAAGRLLGLPLARYINERRSRWDAVRQTL
jgi:hypothetical protein